MGHSLLGGITRLSTLVPGECLAALVPPSCAGLDASALLDALVLLSCGRLRPVNETETRPWGEYEILAEVPSFKVKTITVDVGQRLSYQRHQHRSEHWYVVDGTGLVTLDDSIA